MTIIRGSLLQDPFNPIIKAEDQTSFFAGRSFLFTRCQTIKSARRSAPTLLVRSFSNTLKIKVFENQELGIVCYKDDQSGEVICEGYDEGPRYDDRRASPAIHTDSFRSRQGVLIPHGLQSMRRVEEGSAIVLCINGFAAQEPEKL